MLLNNYSNETKCYLVIIVACIIQYVVIFVKQHNHILIDDEAKSAIQRAKTDSCKKQIYEFSAKFSNDQQHMRQHLRRSCPSDTGGQLYNRLGCIPNNTSNLMVIEDRPSDLTDCLDTCFSYGHSHGGLGSDGELCYCGDIDSKQDFSPIGHCREDEVDLYKVNYGVAQRVVGQSSVHMYKKNSERFKIAFLLSLNGRYISQIRRLLKNIYSPNHIYYIHVDPREDYLFDNLIQLETKYANVIVAKSRFETIWGGPRLLTMMLDAMKNLARYDWDYFINLSESDFPIKNITQLEYYLATHDRFLYLKTHNMKGYNFIKKQGLDWNFYQCENRVWRLGKRQLTRGIVFSGGSDWVALPKEFCTYIIDNVHNGEGLVKPLLHLYNFTLLPAESFFHTLALNSKYCDIFRDSNLRMTNWQRKQGCKCQHKSVVDWCGCSPLVYRWSDWPRLQRTRSMKDIFFSRKFDPTISSTIINAVEQNLVYDNQQTPRTDSRFWFLAANAIRENSNLDRFAKLAIKQISDIDVSSIEISEKLYVYFNKDRLVGFVIKYCDDKMDCNQLLIEKRKNSNVLKYNESCQTHFKSQLKVIEVNQGFDTGERMFRNYMPLDENSDIVVYHEWVVQDDTSRDNGITNKIQFTWSSPRDYGTQLVQDIKLKPTSKASKLSLVHRLNVKRPVASGIWSLNVIVDGVICLNYEFMVLGLPDDFNEQLKDFNRFYQVTSHCSSSGKKCHDHEWTLESMRAADELYGLN